MSAYQTYPQQQQQQILLNDPIYPVPCVYFHSSAGCMYGAHCRYQHIIERDSSSYNRHHVTPPSPSRTNNTTSSNPFHSAFAPTTTTTNDTTSDDEDRKLQQDVASKWLPISKTIPAGSRKNMKMKKFDDCKKQKKRVENDSGFAVMITSCSQDLNGLYIQSGMRNGYIKYTECIEQKASIYCNPRSGWRICYEQAVCYFSYPLTPTPPTDKSKWICQGMNNDKLPLLRTSKVIGHDLIDLLFIGFHRDMYVSNGDELFWHMISTDIIHIFCQYFVECMADRCDNCGQLCENVLLCGFKWLCKECIGEAMN